MGEFLRSLFFKRLRLDPGNPKGSFRRQTRAFDAASVIVMVFYALELRKLPGVLADWENLANVPFVDPLWITVFLDDLIPGHALDIAMMFYVVGVVAGILFFRQQWARVLFFLGVLLSLGITSSYGKIDHGEHLKMLIALTLCFIPDFSKDPSRLVRQKLLTGFVAIQAMILTIYSLAGLWKILAVFPTSDPNRISLFSMGAFPNQIAFSFIEKQTTSVAGRFLMEQQGLALVVGIAGVFFEFFALVALFRPRLHAIFGFALVFLHTGAILIMKIWFLENIIFLGLFLCASPFAPAVDLRKSLVRMPPISWIYFVWCRRKSAGKGSSARSKEALTALSGN